MTKEIPGEIKKWIEDEAEKYTANRLTKDKFIYGATKMYQHLQENGRVRELELYKKKVEFYREQTDKVREFVFSRKDIGEPCQPLYDAIHDKLTEQANRVAELEKEVEKWKSEYNKLYRRFLDSLPMEDY